MITKEQAFTNVPLQKKYVARLLGISRRTVYRLLDRGELAACDVDSLARYLQTCRKK